MVVFSEQFMQVQDQPTKMWSQAALQKMPPMQVSPKQQPPFFMPHQESLKLFEPPPQLSSVDNKFSDVKMPDFPWEPWMSDMRMKRPPPGVVCADQEALVGPRGPPFEVSCRGLGWEGGGAVTSCCSASRKLSSFFTFVLLASLCLLPPSLSLLHFSLGQELASSPPRPVKNSSRLGGGGGAALC